MKSKKNISELEIAEVYTKNAVSFDLSYEEGKGIDNRYIEWPAMKKLVKSVPKSNGKKLLDIGCGTGRHIENYAKMGFHPTGIDISEGVLELARSRNPTVPFYKMSMQKLKFQPNQFDIATSSLAFHYGDFHQIAGQVNRILKLNGHLIFSTTNPFDDARERIQINGKEISAIGKITDIKTKKPRVIGNYFSTGIRSAFWKTKRFRIKWKHTTIGEMIRSFNENGFQIIDFVEAKPVPKAKKTNPFRYRYASRIPVIILFKLQKVKNVKK